ncbi:Polynucleotide 5'-hydroxyl-kinase nol9 [Desmophyllum pertusum]|uniref:Polynucleotide 5'-hydroxyl-kinase NOL9 n=1 Tax=Desmophyllum pertusum TaxID=174260 RepID=A0A9W9YH32_9CNID|nr:Polynucleotide 5'-hydroxyl-kinase nol9 [Desmophyllum pertusum]
MPSDRRKRSLTPHSTVKKTNNKRIRKDSQTSASKAGRTSAKHVEEREQGATALILKSVLPLSGVLANACLLFLGKGQKVCIKGMALIKTLTGLVNIFGSNIGPNHDAVQIFSPSTSSLVTLSECSEVDTTKKTDLKKLLKDALQSQSSEVFKKALARAKKAATVLLMTSLQTVDTNFVCSFQCFEQIFSLDLGKDNSLGSTELSLKKKTADLGFILLEPDSNRCGVLTVPEEWKVVNDALQVDGETQEVKAPVVLICGGKDIGKSTFARYLTNSLLNNQKELYFLECDVGQTEFTPPGIVSLNRVCSPLLGPPFTHLSQPERSVFFGDVSPKDRPEFYVKCIHNVFQTYADHYRNKIPLIVNTQGWVKGMGVSLLLDVIRMVQPSHIIQFNYASQELTNRNMPTITEDFLMSTPGWAFPIDEENQCSNNQRDGTDNLEEDEQDKSSLSFDPIILQIDSASESSGDSSTSKFGASDKRTLALLSYFSKTKMNNGPDEPCEDPSSLTVTSVLSCIPYKIPWSCVAIHVMHTEIAWSQILYSINASVVGLAQTRSDQMYRQEDDDNTPFYITESPITECIGLGIVRNIDPVKRLLYVITPLSLDTLRQVNTLLKGNLEIPALLLSAKQGNVPYVSAEFSYELRGAGARKVRYNLLRRKTTRLSHHVQT